MGATTTKRCLSDCVSPPLPPRGDARIASRVAARRLARSVERAAAAVRLADDSSSSFVADVAALAAASSSASTVTRASARAASNRATPSSPARLATFSRSVRVSAAHASRVAASSDSGGYATVASVPHTRSADASNAAAARVSSSSSADASAIFQRAKSLRYRRHAVPKSDAATATGTGAFEESSEVRRAADATTSFSVVTSAAADRRRSISCANRGRRAVAVAFAVAVASSSSSSSFDSSSAAPRTTSGCASIMYAHRTTRGGNATSPFGSSAVRRFAFSKALFVSPRSFGGSRHRRSAAHAGSAARFTPPATSLACVRASNARVARSVSGRRKISAYASKSRRFASSVTRADANRRASANVVEGDAAPGGVRASARANDWDPDANDPDANDPNAKRRHARCTLVAARVAANRATRDSCVRRAAVSTRRRISASRFASAAARRRARRDANWRSRARRAAETRATRRFAARGSRADALDDVLLMMRGTTGSDRRWGHSGSREYLEAPGNAVGRGVKPGGRGEETSREETSRESMSCSVFRRRRKKNPGADVAGCVTTLPLSGGSDHDAGATTFGTGRVRGRAREWWSRGEGVRRARDAGRVETMSLPRRGRARPRRARRSRTERRYRGKNPGNGGYRARAPVCARRGGACARGVRVRSAFPWTLPGARGGASAGASSGRVGTADGGRARRAFGCRVSLCTGVHERVAAPRGAPYRRSRHRGGHRGVEWEETEETDARDARVLSLDASTRGRYCRGARPSRQSRSLRLGKRVQKN